MKTKSNQLFVLTFVASLGLIVQAQKALAESEGIVAGSAEPAREGLPTGSITTKDGMIIIVGGGDKPAYRLNVVRKPIVENGENLSQAKQFDVETNLPPPLPVVPTKVSEESHLGALSQATFVSGSGLFAEVPISQTPLIIADVKTDLSPPPPQLSRTESKPVVDPKPTLPVVPVSVVYQHTERTLNGIDVSSWEHDVNFATLKAHDVSFAYLKATEGRNFRDPDFALNRQNARQAGIVYGAYHFFRPATPVMDQVDNFLATVGQIKPNDLPPALDLEDKSLWKGYSMDEKKMMILTWLQEVEKRTGVRPIIYASPKFIRDVLGSAGELANYKLWLAHYTNHSEPDLPAPFASWLIWQFTDKGSMPGVERNVDLNRYHGDVNQLLAEARNNSHASLAQLELGTKSGADPALDFSGNGDS